MYERRNAIINILHQIRHTTVANLANSFGVSERTIYSDITTLALDHPIRTVRGRYGGGVELESWFRPHANTLSPKQEELLLRLKTTLVGDDLIVLNSILLQFYQPHGCR